MIRIAVDAMGGDHAPSSIIDGALAAARHLDLGLLLAGPADVDSRRARETSRRRTVQHPHPRRARCHRHGRGAGGRAAAQAARVDSCRGRRGGQRRGLGARERGSHRRDGAVRARRVRHAAWRRSAGAGGDHSIGRSPRHSARRRRQRGMPRVAPAAVRRDGRGVREDLARHRAPAHRAAVDRRGREQGHRADSRRAPAAEGLVA